MKYRYDENSVKYLRGGQFAGHLDWMSTLGQKPFPFRKPQEAESSSKERKRHIKPDYISILYNARDPLPSYLWDVYLLSTKSAPQLPPPPLLPPHTPLKYLFSWRKWCKSFRDGSLYTIKIAIVFHKRVQRWSTTVFSTPGMGSCSRIVL